MSYLSTLTINKDRHLKVPIARGWGRGEGRVRNDRDRMAPFFDVAAWVS